MIINKYILFCVLLLNDFLIIQFFLVFILLLLNTNIELFFILLNSIIYLLLIVCYTWLHDVEIIINFLLIIDLGVFFILLAFLLNLTSLFTQTLDMSQLNKQIYLGLFLLVIYLTVQYILNLILNYNYTVYFGYSWFMLITYYNWYNIYNIIYFSDLQLLADIYFFFNLLEFVIMNLIIYLSIFIVYFGIHNWYWLKTYIFFNQLKYLMRINNYHIQYFFKTQNMQNQIQTKGVTRIWSKFNN